MINIFKTTDGFLTFLLHFHYEKLLFTFMNLAGAFFGSGGRGETIHKQTSML